MAHASVQLYDLDCSGGMMEVTYSVMLGQFSVLVALCSLT